MTRTGDAISILGALYDEWKTPGVIIHLRTSNQVLGQKKTTIV